MTRDLAREWKAIALHKLGHSETDSLRDELNKRLEPRDIMVEDVVLEKSGPAEEMVGVHQGNGPKRAGGEADGARQKEKGKETETEGPM